MTFVLVQSVASFPELRRLRQQAGDGQREGWIEGPEEEKTDGGQTFTQRGSGGSYWRTALLSMKSALRVS